METVDNMVILEECMRRKLSRMDFPNILNTAEVFRDWLILQGLLERGKFDSVTDLPG